MNMGELGVFEVSIFVDGFKVKHVESSDELEVSNMGSKAVFATAKHGDETRSVMANMHGQTIECSVQALIPEGADLTPLSLKTLSSPLPCSVAAFGPTVMHNNSGL